MIEIVTQTLVSEIFQEIQESDITDKKVSKVALGIIQVALGTVLLPFQLLLPQGF